MPVVTEDRVEYKQTGFACTENLHMEMRLSDFLGAGIIVRLGPQLCPSAHRNVRYVLAEDEMGRHTGRRLIPLLLDEVRSVRTGKRLHADGSRNISRRFR